MPAPSIIAALALLVSLAHAMPSRLETRDMETIIRRDDNHNQTQSSDGNIPLHSFTNSVALSDPELRRPPTILMEVAGEIHQVALDLETDLTWLFTDPSQLPVGTNVTRSYWDGTRLPLITVESDYSVGRASFVRQQLRFAAPVDALAFADVVGGGLGLGFGLTKDDKSFMDSITYALKEPLFTFDFPHQGDARFTLGEIDPARFKAPLFDIPVNTDSPQWGFLATEYRVSGENFSHPAASRAIMSTLSPYIQIDPEPAAFYYKNVSNVDFEATSMRYFFPCDTKLPDFTMILPTGQEITIPGQNLVLGGVHSNADLCEGAIRAGSHWNVQTIGMPFFRTFFTVFGFQDRNLEAPYIKFAPYP